MAAVADRLPPGQVLTEKFPVLQFGQVPSYPDLSTWDFKVWGAVEKPLTLTWAEVRSLPARVVTLDIHCVTRWSRLDNVWEGVSVREVLDRAGVKPAARFVVAHGYDSGWTTNLPLADVLAEDALFADTHDGQPLSADHGGPCRLIVPRLYAWKSAKWIKAIELTADDRPGYWEQGGYHNHGDPWVVSAQYPDGERFG